MGGTTAKSCLIEDGVPARTTDFEVARVYRFKKGSGIPLLVPAVDMIEIGAGGGSVARVNALGLIQVGPDSSGALPGPACYGQGGAEPTVTDADLVLGFLDAGSFLGGDMKLDPDAARRAIEVRIGDPLGLSLTEAAWGVCETVDENMSQATTIHALEKGLRAADFTLVAIGGAGPVHAAHVARKMGIGRVICPAGAGVASAFGFLAAPLSFESVQADVTPLAALDADAVRALVSGLEQRGRQLLAGSGVDERDFGVRVACAMRYIGQGHEVEVAVPPEVIDAADRDRLRGLFEQTYHALFGRIEATMPVEMVSWRVVVSGPRPDVKPSRAATADLAAALKGRRPVYDPESRQFLDTPVLDRYRLAPGFALTGPAIVEERESTAVVPARARAAVDDFGNLLIDLPA
jgi:N-methylhydantoinase A